MTRHHSGLWIFVRDPNAKPEVVAAARKALQELGFTLERLRGVEQAGCKYCTRGPSSSSKNPEHPEHRSRTHIKYLNLFISYCMTRHLVQGTGYIKHYFETMFCESKF